MENCYLKHIQTSLYKDVLISVGWNRGVLSGFPLLGSGSMRMKYPKIHAHSAWKG